MGVSCDQGLGALLHKIDAIDQEAYAFLRQQIIHRIYWESHRLGQQPLSQAVINAVCQHYHQEAQLWNYNFRTLVVR